MISHLNLLVASFGGVKSLVISDSCYDGCLAVVSKFHNSFLISNACLNFHFVAREDSQPALSSHHM